MDKIKNTNEWLKRLGIPDRSLVDAVEENGNTQQQIYFNQYNHYAGGGLNLVSVVAAQPVFSDNPLPDWLNGDMSDIKVKFDNFCDGLCDELHLVIKTTPVSSDPIGEIRGLLNYCITQGRITDYELCQSPDNYLYITIEYRNLSYLSKFYDIDSLVKY